MGALAGADQVLARPSEVTPDWLTEILRSAGRLEPGGSVTGVVCEPVGTGQMADTVRYSVTYSPPEAGPASVVAKFASTDEQSHATGKAMRAYEIEARFYAEVASASGARVPGCLFAALDPEEAWFTLVLDDIVGASQGDQVVGCDADRAAAVVTEIAALHAPSWGSTSLASLGWLNRSSPESDAFTAAVVTGLLPAFLERYGEALDPAHVALFEAFIPELSTWFALRGGPRTLVHGDFRLDNLLFTVGDPRPVVVDFQTLTWASGSYDLAYFLGGCLTPAIRRRCEEDLMASYHQALVAGGVEGYPIEALREDYRRECFGGVMMAVGASMLVRQTERGDQMFVTSASRHAQHAIDLEALEVLR